MRLPLPRPRAATSLASLADGDVLLSVDNLHVSYGLIPALRGVTLEVRAGEMVALLGANGAGKTTTLRAISGLIKPRAGSISFGGERIDGLSATDVVRRGIAHLPEGRDLFPGLSVKENLRYGAWPVRRDRRGFHERLEAVYTAFPKLKDRSSQKAGTLSGGEQQMLGVGIALMSNPKLLIVDELSLGLAPLIVTKLFEELKRVNALGTAVLLVEQFVPLALANTDRAYVLAKGEVQLAGNSGDLADDPELVASYLGGATGHGGGSSASTATSGGGTATATKSRPRTSTSTSSRSRTRTRPTSPEVDES